MDSYAKATIFFKSRDDEQGRGISDISISIFKIRISVETVDWPGAGRAQHVGPTNWRRVRMTTWTVQIQSAICLILGQVLGGHCLYNFRVLIMAQIMRTMLLNYFKEKKGRLIKQVTV